jgi:hypothetical protein
MDDQLAFVNSSSTPHHSPMISFDFNVMKQNLTSVQELYRTSAVTVAMFLNCLVILVVSNSRQLRYPRHVFWAAVSLFECLFLFECILELVVVNNHDELACRIFILLCPVDYSILLICLAMAAFDRYLAIARYEWYKETVTNRGVVATVSAASAVTFVVVTIPFWTDHQSIYTCTLNLSHVHWVYVLNFLLGIVCVLLHVKIFLASKSVIRQYLPSYPTTSVTVTFVKDRSKIRPSLFSGELRIDLDFDILYLEKLCADSCLPSI